MTCKETKDIRHWIYDHISASASFVTDDEYDKKSRRMSMSVTRRVIHDEVPAHWCASSLMIRERKKEKKKKKKLECTSNTWLSYMIEDILETLDRRLLNNWDLEDRILRVSSVRSIVTWHQSFKKLQIVVASNTRQSRRLITRTR